MLEELVTRLERRLTQLTHEIRHGFDRVTILVDAESAAGGLHIIGAYGKDVIANPEAMPTGFTLNSFSRENC
jgi:hypothetical protein